MNSIAVYCASNLGAPEYTKTAYTVGKTLAERGIRVVFGGGRHGLMGVVANGALEAGGEVTGVIPDFMGKREQLHEGLSEVYIVKTMHQRKSKMVELADGVIVLPGGYGTLDEFFEILVWSQLRLFPGPVGLLNVNGYYDLLLAYLDKAADEKFLKPENRALIQVSTGIEELLDKMTNFVRE